MGVTFKGNCPDIRNTKVIDLVRELKCFNLEVDIYDPCADPNEVYEAFNVELTNTLVPASYDGIILAVDHTSIKEMGQQFIRSLGKDPHVLFDMKYLFAKNESDLRMQNNENTGYGWRWIYWFKVNKKILFETNHEVLNVDKLTYASNRVIIDEFKRFSRYKFSKTDICNSIEVDKIISNFAPNWILHNALRGLSLPIYGDGQQVRDRLHVDDHAAALLLLCDRGKIGERYNVGTCQEHTNIFLVHMICDILDELLQPERIRIKTFRELIQFIEDRPGHDKRYAINPKKIMKNLNWAPEINFTDGLHDTVKSYIDAQIRLTDFFNSQQDMKR